MHSSKEKEEKKTFTAKLTQQNHSSWTNHWDSNCRRSKLRTNNSLKSVFQNVCLYSQLHLRSRACLIVHWRFRNSIKSWTQILLTSFCPKPYSSGINCQAWLNRCRPFGSWNFKNKLEKPFLA
jgi:hypothetical protein